MHNFNIWVPRFRDDFIPSIRRVEKEFHHRILPTFASIATESDELEETLWLQAQSRPYDEDGPDEGVVADAVRSTATEHYLGLLGMRQGLLNCCALFLFHLFEQQLMILLRDEFLPWNARHDRSKFHRAELVKRLKDLGTDVETFASWPVIVELEALANTIKHAEGRSSVQLLKTAPRLFSRPASDDFHAMSSRSGLVYAPLLGEDIYVTPAHNAMYAQAIEDFWLALGRAMTQEP